MADDDIQISHRFGWDMPSRIQATADYYAGAAEMPIPGEPVLKALLPFPDLAGIGLPAGAGGTVIRDWRKAPERFDLYFPAGDDITIPLTFNDADYPTIDMTDQDNWKWYAHVRTGQGPAYRLIAEFTCTSSHESEKTKVVLYLPRQYNYRSGDFYWDLQGVNPVAMGGGEDAEEDPTPGTAHTYLSGRCHITSEVTTLPDEWPPKTPGVYQGTSVFTAIHVGGGKTIGPTGQVG